MPQCTASGVNLKGGVKGNFLFGSVKYTIE